MKKFFRLLTASLLILLSSCDPVGKEIQCYPTRITITVATGSGSTAIISDFYYSGDTLINIVFSTGQTHYYHYDAEGRVDLVKEVNDRLLRKEEHSVTYDGELPVRIDISAMNLDYEYRTDLDTFYFAYREFGYTGKVLDSEACYERTDPKTAFSLIKEQSYTYDPNGNLTGIIRTDHPSEALTVISMTYDQQKNPYSALPLLFNGEETYVNNLTSLTNSESGSDFSYTLIYNDDLYPQLIIEEDNGYSSRNMKYTYDCR